MLIQVLLMFLGLVVLIMGGDFLVRGASSIALRAHISPLVVGLTIVAFGTSAPELLISLKAALSGSPDMTMGNVVGSNICNLALVLGITCMISTIKVNADSIKIDWPVTMGSSLLLYFVVTEDNPLISRYEGLVFIGLLVVYTVFIIRKSRMEIKSIKALEQEMDLPDSPSKNIWKDLFFIALGSVGLFFGADWFVTGASDIAEIMGVSHRVIGLTILALGTSLPELVTSIVAAFKKETDLALGNLMGSNIFNIFSILGITSLIKEIHVSEEIIKHDIFTMLGITLLLFPLMIVTRKLNRFSGIILLAIYVIYTYTIII